MAKTHLLTPDAAAGTVSGALVATATTVNVVTGQGASFGTIGADSFVPCTIRRKFWVPGDPIEHVDATARSSDALTVDALALSWAEDADNPAMIFGTAPRDDHLQFLRAAYEAADGSFLEKSAGEWEAVS